VAKIIGDHGGLIEVDSRPGKTDFRLFLPVFPEDDLTGEEAVRLAAR
jgi:two-component system nitrogen regulation sensor histidine kinase GlnL